MVELTAERGIDARLADAGALPFADDEFDAVVACRMLYHLPELWTLVGAEGNPGPRPFNRDNGAEILERHFAQVGRLDLTTKLVFPDRDAVVTYVAATLTRNEYAGRVPDLDGPFETRLLQTLFLASTPG